MKERVFLFVVPFVGTDDCCSVSAAPTPRPPMSVITPGRVRMARGSSVSAMLSRAS